MGSIKYHFSITAPELSLPDTNIFFLKMPQEDSEILTYYFPHLNLQEQNKSQDYALTKPRNQYIISKALTRLLLAQFLKVVPQDIEFETNEFGKPFLAPKYNSPITFNVSHSGQIFMMGLTSSLEIGVDIEIARKEIKVMDIAKYAFAPEERELLQTLPLAETAHQTFYRIWAGKEAFIKAVGSGVSFGLDKFVLNFHSARDIFIQEIRDPSLKITDFTIQDLTDDCLSLDLFKLFASGKDLSALHLGASVVTYQKF